MGAEHSRVSYVPEELELRTGAINASLPFKHDGSSYESVKNSSEAKEYISANIDSDYLINSLLSQDLEESKLFAGLTCYQQLKQEDLDNLEKNVRNLENCSRAGVQVRSYLRKYYIFF
jgi:hypothetical protein